MSLMSHCESFVDGKLPEEACLGSLLTRPLNSAIRFHLIYVPAAAGSLCPRPTTFLSPPLHLPFAFAQGRCHPAKEHLSCGVFYIHGKTSVTVLSNLPPHSLHGYWGQAPQGQPHLIVTEPLCSHALCSDIWRQVRRHYSDVFTNHP